MTGKLQSILENVAFGAIIHTAACVCYETDYKKLMCNHCKHPAHCGHGCSDENCDHCTECACDRCQVGEELYSV
jgi:hypothetical protein